MSEVITKAVSLAQAKTLYDDLRQRIENGIGAATLEETQAIIDNYGEDDDEVLIETEWYVNPSSSYDVGFVSVLDASVIAGYLKAGKTVVAHLPRTEGQLTSASYGMGGERYLQICEYSEGYTDPVSGDVYDPAFFLATSGNSIIAQDGHSNQNSVCDMITSTGINSDGKLYLKAYVD